MDYEDKHKEEIIRATQLWECGDITRGNLEYIFPELAESEDERIRKVLVELVKCNERCGYFMINNITTSAMLAWLEKPSQQPKKVLIWKHWKNGIAGNGNGEQIYLIKIGTTYSISSCLGCECDYIELSELDNLLQGEQKETLCDKCKKEQPSHSCQDITALGRCYIDGMNTDNKIEPKFKVGDFIANDYCVGKVIALTDDAYLLDTGQGIPFSCEHNAHLWTIQDAKDGDVLVYNNGLAEIILLFERWMNGVGEGAYSYAHTFDNKILFNDWSDCGYAAHPATKEQRDFLFKAMKEEGYEWDADKKELKKIEDEEYNGEDYGIDSLFHAQRILEKTLGEVEGYQSDDGILEHKCAISAVKKLYARKPAKWSEEDEVKINRIVACLENLNVADNDILLKDVEWLKSLKQRMEEQQ